MTTPTHDLVRGSIVMPFVRNRYIVEERVRATRFLIGLGYSPRQCQRMLDRRRVMQHGAVIGKQAFLEPGECFVVEFEAVDVPNVTIVAICCVDVGPIAVVPLDNTGDGDESGLLR